MARIVMKFGGTSMAGIERIRHVAGLVKREAERGNDVAVVVSRHGRRDRPPGAALQGSRAALRPARI